MRPSREQTAAALATLAAFITNGDRDDQFWLASEVLHHLPDEHLDLIEQGLPFLLTHNDAADEVVYQVRAMVVGTAAARAEQRRNPAATDGEA